MKFFTNKIDWRKCKITQDKNGIYFQNNKTGLLWGTILSKFAKSLAPKGYTKKYDGSHQDTNYLGINIKKQKAINIKKQKAIDISGMVKSINTFDFDVKIEGIYGKGIQRYVIVSWGIKLFGRSRWTLVLVHNKLAKGVEVGQVVKAGKPVSELVYHHTHAYIQRFGLPYDLQKVILGS